eukprot:5566317-Amphidinium_carterae.2
MLLPAVKGYSIAPDRRSVRSARAMCVCNVRIAMYIQEHAFMHLYAFAASLPFNRLDPCRKDGAYPKQENGAIGRHSYLHEHTLLRH